VLQKLIPYDKSATRKTQYAICRLMSTRERKRKRDEVRSFCDYPFNEFRNLI